MNERVVNIPERLILDKELGDDRVLLFAAIALFAEEKPLTLAELTIRAGYHPTAGAKGKIRQFANLLNSLVANGYIDSEQHIIDESHGATISKREFDDILIYKENESCAGKTSPNKISHAKILILLSYIRSRMLRNQDGTPRYYSDHMNYLQDRVGFKSSIKKYVDALVEIGVFTTGKMNAYRFCDAQWHSGSTVFVESKRNDVESYDPHVALEAAKDDLLHTIIRSKAIHHASIANQSA